MRRIRLSRMSLLVLLCFEIVSTVRRLRLLCINVIIACLFFRLYTFTNSFFFVFNQYTRFIRTMTEGWMGRKAEMRAISGFGCGIFMALFSYTCRHIQYRII